MAIAKELLLAYTRIFLVELFYWIVSIGMVFVNEFVLSANLLTDDLTVFITDFQILFSLAILITLNYITKSYPNQTTNQTLIVKLKDPLSVSVSTKLIDNDNFDNNNNQLDCESMDHENNLDHKANSKSTTTTTRTDDNSSDSLMQLFIVNIPKRINLETCKLVFPLSILYIGMLLLNNFCLKYVGVAFYFVSRSLTTVFNVTFTYFIMNEPVSRGALVCCGLIVLSFILGIDQENVIGSLSVIGVLFGVASSLFTSLFSIYTKKTLAKLDRNIWVLILYNNINAIVLCTPLMVLHGDVQALVSDKVVSPSFWFLLSISGVMSFFISIVTNASIKYTSPLTHNISGTAKACFQTVIAVIYRHDHKSFLWWVSNITILVASAAYSRIKQLEMERSSGRMSKEEMNVKLPLKEDNEDSASLLNFKKRLNRNESNSSLDGQEICEKQDKDCCSVSLLQTNNQTN